MSTPPANLGILNSNSARRPQILTLDYSVHRGMAESTVLNFADKTIWTGDNLDIMRGMNSKSVDLIYLDPPFNSNQNYAAPVGSAAAGAAFKDTWTLSDLDVAWMGLIADQQPAVYSVLQAAREAHGKGMQSYLCMMAVRLMEMRRLLKDAGSIYLHCDPTASHYLKLLMDAVFGPGNFRNEVVWKRTAGRSDGKQFGRVHDVLLLYAKRGATWNRQYTGHDPAYLARAYRNEDERGRWRSADLTASGPRYGESGEPWRGIDPGKVGRHWNTPTQGGMNDYIIEHGLVPGCAEVGLPMFCGFRIATVQNPNGSRSPFILGGADG